MNTLKSFIVAATLLYGVQLQAQTADEIIAKYVNAQGGAEKLSSLKTVKMEGAMAVQGTDVQVMLTKKHMEGWRLDLAIMGFSNYQVVNTKKGSVFMPVMQQTDPQEMTPEQFKSALNQLDIQGSLFEYKKKGSSVKLAGEEMVNGKKAYVLKLDKGGEIFNYYIDAETGYLVKTSGMVNNMEMASLYSDFRKNEDGFVFPYTIVNPQGTITWTKITTNQEIDSKLFEN